MKKKQHRLGMKFFTGFVLIAILICGSSNLVGYLNYRSAVLNRYRDNAYSIAEVAAGYIDIGDLETYVDIAKSYQDGFLSEEKIKGYISQRLYTNVSQSLAGLRARMDANDIYVVYIDQDELMAYNGTKENWKPFLYIFDCYTDPAYSYKLGDAGPINPKFIDEMAEIANTGKRSDSFFFSHSDYGYNMSAILPVIGSEGQVVAVIGLEISMEKIQNELKQYLLNSSLISTVIVLLCQAVYMIYLYRGVILPIKKVSDEVRDFIENDNEIADSLREIKTGDEIQTLAENTLQLQTDINSYIKNITRITAEKERIGAELDVANHIQASMLPCIFPPFPNRDEFDVFATMLPAKEVGGDFYDFFMVDHDHVAVVMADVSGKGIPAALFMVIAKTLIKDHTQSGRDLGSVFTEVNDLLCESNSEGLFVTAFEGVLDLVSGEFVFVNAGHEMPFICKKGGKYEAYRIRPGFVLAGLDGTVYKSGRMILEPGDKLFQYTDGIPEATDKDNKLYGMDRLSAVLTAHSDAPGMELLPAVKADIDAFVGDAPQFDDITMLCLEYKKRGEKEQ